MGEVKAYQHREMAAGRWAEMLLAEQMGNIGSEVSRTLKARKMGNEARCMKAFERALELFDLTIECTKEPWRLREICRAREEFCDYFMCYAGKLPVKSFLGN